MVYWVLRHENKKYEILEKDPQDHGQEKTFEEELETYVQHRDRGQNDTLQDDINVDTQVLRDIEMDAFGEGDDREEDDTSRKLSEEDTDMPIPVPTKNKSILEHSGTLQSKFAPMNQRMSMDVEKLSVDQPIFNNSPTSGNIQKHTSSNTPPSQKATKIDVPSRTLSPHVAHTGHE